LELRDLILMGSLVLPHFSAARRLPLTPKGWVVLGTALAPAILSAIAGLVAVVALLSATKPMWAGTTTVSVGVEDSNQ
jgi:ABC-type cobalamin transport system permease subunit